VPKKRLFEPFFGTRDHLRRQAVAKSDQGVNRERYRVIPRTLIFITQGERVLLLRGAETKRLWANRYNGLGGHIERGESVLFAARRELAEEAGVRVTDLRLVGTVAVDASEDTGICLFVLRGEYAGGNTGASPEGQPEWIEISKLAEFPLVEDLQVILPRALVVGPGGAPFSARSFYNEEAKLVVVFEE
jgi:8-oxo-dGTP diphosphatase